MSTCLKPYLSKEQIATHVKNLGEEITKFYAKKVSDGNPLLAIVTLKGALFFAADLLRAVRVPMQIDFVRVASYGASTKTSGTVRILKDIETTLKDRHVLVIDEIVDSGRTLHFILNRLTSGEPKDVRIAALLNKPSRREIPMKVDFIGQDVENEFLVGYGLDFNEQFRNRDAVMIFEFTDPTGN